jgi:general stress protein YciG
MSEVTKRWLNMVEKYGSEEAARAVMRERASKSKRNLGGSGGFAALPKEKLIEISRKGGRVTKDARNN